VKDIPLADLAAQHARIAHEVMPAMSILIERGDLILGEPVARFEAAFAAYCGAASCIGVANGTDAIELALRAANVGAGDEAIIPVNTFAATALAAVRAGVRPVFADCDERYHLLDVDDASRRAGPDVKAIIPVHLFGQLAPMEEIRALADDRGFVVIEDAAQAHGATNKGEPAGRTSAAASFSFYPSKNLGAYGDGGAVVTNDDVLAARLRALRAYGSDRKYDHPIPGFNSRLDAIQAAALLVKLAHLDRWNTERIAAAARYDEMLLEFDELTLPQSAPGNTHVWHLYVVRVPRRDDVLRSLRDQGIGAGIHYPRPLHLEGAFQDLGYAAGDFPVAERLALQVLSLPLYPEITPEQQERVVEALRKALS
jgi:dTDP-4-amino-4,6-dideoxygalactose transaminase